MMSLLRRAHGNALIGIVFVCAVMILVVTAVLPALISVNPSEELCNNTLYALGYTTLTAAESSEVLTYLDNIYSETEIIDTHLHNRERWLGARAGWDGSNTTASGTIDSLTPFILDAGNNTWGAAKCIVGSSDTPVTSTSTYFDLHRLMVSATESNNIYKIRFACGESYAAGIAAGTYTEVVFVPASNQVDSGPVEILMPRVSTGDIIWASTWCAGANTATINFLVGLHEYPE